MKQSSKEEGFTLTELLVVVLIIGILASISVPFYRSSKKSALNATLQSDVHNAVPVVEARFKKIVNEPQIILSMMSISESNSLKLKVFGDPHNPSYCITGINNIYSPYSFYYNSTVGLYLEGDCSNVGENNTIVEVEESGIGSPEVTPPNEENRPFIPKNPNIIEGEYEINDKYTKDNVTYSPTYTFNNFNKGSSVTIRVDITTPSTKMIDWNYEVDLKKAPYWSPLPASIKYTGGHIQSIVGDKLNIKAMNQWNGVSKSNPVTLTYNFTNYQAPNYNNYYKVEVTKGYADKYHACLNVNVIGTSSLPISWSHDIDLNEWFANFKDKTINSEQSNLETLSPDYYRITGNSSNNDYVSNKHSITGPKICYNPNGLTAFK